MQSNSVSIQRITAFALLLFLGIYLLVVGQNILIPLAFGALFAFMLKPVCALFERWVKWRIPSIFFSMLAVAIPFVMLLFFFSTQLVNVFDDMPSIKEKVNTGVEVLYNWTKSTFGFSQAETDKFIKEQLPKILNQPLANVGGGFMSSASFFTSFFLSIIYTFLFLLYRSAFKQFILMQKGDKEQSHISELIQKIQTVIQKYLSGLFLVILILGTLLSLGLWMIGIKHAFFWGFLAAMLAIIPYIGTFIGGFLPFLYALATAEQSWQPFAVVALFIAVQGLEGNLITPNVVGSTVKVNPLAAIVALLVGAEIWGIAGMVLSLPATAVLKEILQQSNAWKPVSYLLSDEISGDQEAFRLKWNSERFRLRNFFKRSK